MAKKITIQRLWFAICLILGASAIQAQRETIVSGIVRNAENGEAIPGATIIVKGKVIGTSTDLEGNFNFGITLPPPFTLVFSALGYEIREYDVIRENQELVVNLRTQAVIDPEIVLFASRVPETVQQSPVAVVKRDLTATRQTPEIDFYNGIGAVKGVHTNQASLVFQSFNTRGFSSIGNPRFLQLVDGVDNAPPGLNFSLGNLAGVSPLDVAEIEVVSGTSSPLYGTSALNGALFITTKSPFDYQGLSISVQNGVSAQESTEINPFVNVGLRFSKVFNDNFAVKINASALRGVDWQATDYNDINNIGTDNPNYNGVNIYGDEVSRAIDLDQVAGTAPGTYGTLQVARTGYNESDLVDYVAETVKFDAAAHYRLTETVEVIGSYRMGTGKSMFQGASRYYFDNVTLQQVRAEIKGANFFLRTYNTFENSGDSYDTRLLAWNLNKAWRADSTWFRNYAEAYVGKTAGVQQGDHAAARAFADRGRFEPRSATFEAAMADIRADANPLTGARFLDKTRLSHTELMYNLTNDIQFMNVLVGASYRRYKLNSEGSLFNDATESIKIGEMGGYVQVSKPLLEGERLRVGGALRFDKNANFDAVLSPRAYLVYSAGVDGEHNFRISYQSGFRYPETQAQYIGLNLGTAYLLGGVAENVENFATQISYVDADGNGQTANVTGAGVYANSYTAASVQRFLSSGNPTDLQALAIEYVKPEQVKTYEIGYRGLLSKRFSISMEYYYNQYENFITNVNAVHPLTGNIGDLTAGRTANFQLYGNLTEKVTGQGLDLAAEYALGRGYRLGGNYSYAVYDSTKVADENQSVVPGFNTPENRFVVHLANKNVYKGVGFRVEHRWSDGYKWVSAFGSGEITKYHVTSAQISYEIPQTNVRLKIGGSNLFKNQYRTAFGTASIGAQYYITLTFNEFL